MKLYKLRSSALGLLITIATFDALTIPVVRLSIADCAMIISLAVFGFTRDTLRRVCYFLFWVAPCVLLVNAAVFFFYEARTPNSGVEFSLLISGFVRPMFFILVSICFYGMLEKWNFSKPEINWALVFAISLLSLIVFAQYMGVSPPMYHNNPSFGETGRFTFFSEGWRPTGLSNEASFVGIFIFLLFVGLIRAARVAPASNSLVPQIGALIGFLGCFFTTSRLALLLAVGFFFFQKPSIRKILIVTVAGLLLIPFLDISRFQNVLAFDGDASTIERYGSFFAYTNALLDPICLWGTGYLNSEAVIRSHIDPLVLDVLGDRQLPAFSLPLQLLVEFGPIFCLLALVFYWIRRKTRISDIRFHAIVFVSFFTGIQNFLFIYVFIALVCYDRYARDTQNGGGRGAHSTVA